MDPAAGVGRPRAAGYERDARAPRHLAVRVGHISDTTFVPTDDRVDLRSVVESVEHGEKAFAGDGEDPVTAVDAKLIDEDASARSGAGAKGHGTALASCTRSGKGVEVSGGRRLDALSSRRYRY